ncbi:TPR repeat protein [Labilithrix luteola]|uniref:TPR repeat protein n=1 Tax=Labilithrix luteola TaxID=1391654 RepID=A0A0K1QCP8_9BACT|nr:tetratricopeptide repeat protein [Labilithrix luteola]AKV03556.1 TPR repeat protein [Labilithrix luteola]
MRRARAQLAMLSSIGLLASACSHPSRPAETTTHAATAPTADVRVQPASIASTAGQAQLFPNLGSYHREVTTKVPAAQLYFDQGLTLLYAFNYDEALRSFTRAAEVDPSCAMCFWGIAAANGPHINSPMVSAAHARDARTALARAQALGGTDVERALVAAQAKRFSAEPNAPRGPLDKAYADAMRDAYKRFPNDPEVGTLYAEAMMDLRPWDLWTNDGRPSPGTEEIVRVLEAVLAKTPNNPGANHFLIHAVEASTHPERALASADRLRTLVPGAGHLVHMPSHIYMRLGRYEDASEANRRAIVADREYAARSLNQLGTYATMYRAHNVQFLWASAMMEGRSAESLAAGRELQRQLSPSMVEAMPGMFDPSAQAPLLTLLRFGRSADVLREPPLDPELRLPVSNLLRHYARSLSFLRLDRLDEAVREQEEVTKAANELDPKYMVGNGTPAKTLATIAAKQLEGEIAAKQGNYDEAVSALKAAVAAEDTIHYNEPPVWAIPSRELLGAVLIEAERLDEAEATYRDDLKKHPENGYSLFGLATVLRAKRSPELWDVERRLRNAWSRADVELTNSRY